MSDNCPQCGEPYTIHTTGGCPRMRLVEYPYIAPQGGCPICAANAPLLALAREFPARGVVPSAPSLEAIEAGTMLINHIGNLTGERPTADELPMATKWLTELDRLADRLAAVIIAHNLAGGLSSAAAPPVTDEQIHAALIESPRATLIRLTDAEAVPLVRAVMVKLGGVASGGVPREPSEAAVEAAREASGKARGQPDNLLGRRVVLAVLRAAYAVDRVRDSGGVAPAGGTK